MNTDFDRSHDRGNGSTPTSDAPTHYASVGWMPLAVAPITPSPVSGSGSYIAPLWPDTGRWVLAPDNDPEARALFRRHAGRPAENGHPNGTSSRKARTLPGSGDRLILTTHQADALIVFRRWGGGNPDREFGHGVHCAVFRNEGHFRSCSLIREAVEEWAWKRWPGERLYTYIGGQRIAATSPGHAFKRAGWRRCGVIGGAVGGLIVLELLPPPR